MPLLNGFPDSDITKMADITFKSYGYLDENKPTDYLEFIAIYCNIQKQIIWEFTRDKILDSLNTKFCYTNIYTELLTAYELIEIGKIPNIIRTEYYKQANNLPYPEWLRSVFKNDEDTESMFKRRWKTALICKIGYERNVKDIIFTDIDPKRHKTDEELKQEDEIWRTKVIEGVSLIDYETQHVPPILKDEFEIYNRTFWQNQNQS